MHEEFHRRLMAYVEAAEPFAVATVVRVRGSASAKPGSKAIIDRAGRNVHGWVGGGCAETLVREQALQSLEDRLTRIVNVDLDDEVLGVGMPCGGMMDVYIEPHFPPQRLLIAGHNRLARHLNLLAQGIGYAVTVHGPEAESQHFPGAAHIVAEPWDALRIAPEQRVIATPPHEGQASVLRAGLAAQPEYFGFVARRTVVEALSERLAADGVAAMEAHALRNPAGLDLGGTTVEEISLSIVGELLALERGASARPLREVKEMPGFEGGASGNGAPLVPGGKALVPSGHPELLIVGHGRLAEELARIGTLMGWAVTVNAVDTVGADFPPTACMVLGDLDFSKMEVTSATHVVIATLHKGDHLSMERALAGDAAYVGLIASRKRSGLVLNYLRERGRTPDDLAHVHAPAGLDLGARTPAEIALSIACEILRVHRGGSGAFLSDMTREGSADGGQSGSARSGGGQSGDATCRTLFE